MTESEYITFWKSCETILSLKEGQSVTLDWLGERRRFIRARDEKGRFTGTQHDTLTGWVSRMENDGRYKGYLKRVLKEIFIMQLLSGRTGLGRQQPYSDRYKKRKVKNGAFLEAEEFGGSFKVRKGEFNVAQQGVYNLYYSGQSMTEFYSSGASKITKSGANDVSVSFSITPAFARNEEKANERNRTLGVWEDAWKLDNQSLLFFVTNIVMPYVKEHQGVITDLSVEKEEDLYESARSPIDYENDDELPF